MSRLRGVKGARFILMLAPLLSASALAQQSRVLMEDAKAVVTEVDLSPAKPYTLRQSQNGMVWVALDPATLLILKGRQREIRQIHAGDSGTNGAGEELQFHVDGSSRGRLTLIQAKTPHQELTVGPFDLRSSIEDASDRNATLLVALTDCRFRDTQNLGDESRWVPSKPDMVVMKVGSVKWIAPGIHHFENAGRTPAKLVSIEW